MKKYLIVLLLGLSCFFVKGQVLKLVLNQVTSKDNLWGNGWSDWSPKKEVDLLCLINNNDSTIKIIGHVIQSYKYIKFYGEETYLNGETGLKFRCLSDSKTVSTIEYVTIPNQNYELLKVIEENIIRVYRVSKSEYLKKN